MSTAGSASEAVRVLRGASRSAQILLACHVNPDGDALGSMLAMGLGLRQLGYTGVVATFPKPFGVVEAFEFLPGQDLLVPPDKAPPRPEIGMSFDASSPQRLGELVAALSQAPTWMVLDHHVSNHGFGTLALVDHTAAATAVVAAALLADLGVELDPDIATCLYLGVVTDTGSFKFDTTTPAVLELASRLVAAGARPAMIARHVFDTRLFAAQRLLGLVLSRAELDRSVGGGRGLVSAFVTQAELAAYALPPDVLEGFIDSIRTTAEADVACMVKPAEDGHQSVSLRSRGETNVSAIATQFGGGGHRLAAGFTCSGTPEEVVAHVREALDRTYG